MKYNLILATVLAFAFQTKASDDLTKDSTFTKSVEGPSFYEGSLYAVNYQKNGTIGKIETDGKAAIFVTLPEGSVGNGIVYDKKGFMYIADYKGHNVLKLDPKSKKVTVHAHNDKFNQPNDVAIMDNGIIFCSDPEWVNFTGRIWRVDRDGKTTILEENMGNTNGIEVSPDNKTLYVNEGIHRNVYKYNLAPDGSISNKKLLIQFADGNNDGMRCDELGNLYIARYSKGNIAVVSPEGKLLEEIPLKGKCPTNVAFGGKDGKTLYVTIQDRGNIEYVRVKHKGKLFR